MIWKIRRCGGLYVLPETHREEKHLEGHEVPCNQSKLSQWIMEWLGYQQTLAQPSVAAVNKDKAESYRIDKNLSQIPFEIYTFIKSIFL